MSVYELPEPGDELLTKQQLADLLQVSKRTIDNYVGDGMPWMPTKGGKRFWPNRCLRWLSEHYGGASEAIV
jgi:phage terminase Nu1 subunit (DNA packaging protein)